MWLSNEKSQREIKVIGKKIYICTLNAKGTGWGQNEWKEHM